MIRKNYIVILMAGVWLFVPFFSFATGEPQLWGVGMQEAATPVMSEIRNFHDLLLLIIFGIGIFVFCLVGYVLFRFRASRNSSPSQKSHNTILEIIWTLVPIIILVIIAFPSFRLLYFMDKIEDADFTVKVIGHQWYWSYEYPDHSNIGFDSMMIEDKDLKPGQPRLLAVDNPLVLPVGKTIKILATSDDVIHSWAVPSFGIKKDTVPGRINETWVRIEMPGTYYGQCSELCGPRHAFMPIAVKAVPQEEFNAWLEGAREKYA